VNGSERRQHTLGTFAEMSYCFDRGLSVFVEPRRMERAIRRVVSPPSADEAEDRNGYAAMKPTLA
jgi:hypothetical protein